MSFSFLPRIVRHSQNRMMNFTIRESVFWPSVRQTFASLSGCSCDPFCHYSEQYVTGSCRLRFCMIVQGRVHRCHELVESRRSVSVHFLQEAQMHRGASGGPIAHPVLEPRCSRGVSEIHQYFETFGWSTPFGGYFVHTIWARSTPFYAPLLRSSPACQRGGDSQWRCGMCGPIGACPSGCGAWAGPGA